MRWPGMAWTVRDPILTGTVFFCVERPLPAFGLLSKDSFLKALSKKPLRGVSGCREFEFGGTSAAAPVSSARLRRVRILGVLGGLRCCFSRCEQACRYREQRGVFTRVRYRCMAVQICVKCGRSDDGALNRVPRPEEVP